MFVGMCSFFAHATVAHHRQGLKSEIAEGRVFEELLRTAFRTVLFRRTENLPIRTGDV